MTRAASASRTSVAVTWIVAVAAVVVMVWVVWGLRDLIVPAFVGGVLAYICRPLVAGLERRRIPRGVAAGLLLLTFASVALVGLNSLRAAMPTEIEALELRVRALRALTRSYQTIMGLDASWTRGNRLYWLAHRDLDPLVDRVSEVLALTRDEQAQLVASRSKLLDDGCKRADARERGGRPGAPPDIRDPVQLGADVRDRALRRDRRRSVDWVIAPLSFCSLGAAGAQARRAQRGPESASEPRSRCWPTSIARWATTCAASSSSAARWG